MTEYVLVPIEPTAEMIKAGASSEDAVIGSSENCALHTYRAMLLASPTPEQPHLVHCNASRSAPLGGDMCVCLPPEQPDLREGLARIIAPDDFGIQPYGDSHYLALVEAGKDRAEGVHTLHKQGVCHGEKGAKVIGARGRVS